MPWKNGGGVTTELYRLQHPSFDDFLLRLSIATVNSDGPFSIYPGIDRTLLLLEGNGFLLNKNGCPIVLNKKLTPLFFSGEDKIDCQLIQGTCRDFNVMTSRDMASSSVEIVPLEKNQSFKTKTDCDLQFVYDIQTEKLYQLEKNETYDFCAPMTTELIVININFV